MMAAERRPADSIDGIETPGSRLINHFFHDFKGELSTVILCLESVRSGAGGAVTGTQERFLGKAAKNCEHMVALINDYRDTCLMEEGEYPRDVEGLDLGALFEDLRTRYAPYACERGLVLRFIDGGALPRATFRAALLGRALNRLYRVIIDNTRQGGLIASEIKAAGGQLHVDVAWEGIEIDSAQSASVFERGRQTETGLLLGRGFTMLFCRTAAEYLGGALTLNPWAGRGNRIAVRVPYAAPPVAGG